MASVPRQRRCRSTDSGRVSRSGHGQRRSGLPHYSLAAIFSTGSSMVHIQETLEPASPTRC